MKKRIKRLQTRIKNSLIIKIKNLRKENKFLKDKIIELTLMEHKYIDELSIKQSKIRELTLKLQKYEKEN